MKKTKIQYIGRRVINDRIQEAFLHKGKEVYFRKHKWGNIGSWYEAEEVGKGGLQKRDRSPECNGPEANEEKLALWSAKDVMAAAKYKRQKASEKVKKNPKIFEPLRELLPLFSKLTIHEQIKFSDAMWDWLHSNQVRK
jgi:hypothetical protein